MNISKRMQKLETAKNLKIPPQVAEWIDAGMYFDELTPAQKEAYSKYRWNTIEPPDKAFCVFPYFEYTEHFKLDRIPPPPTQAELIERMVYVENYMNKAIAEYNSPEAIAKRKADYDAMCRIGELNRQKFYSDQESKP